MQFLGTRSHFHQLQLKSNRVTFSVLPGPPSPLRLLPLSFLSVLLELNPPPKAFLNAPPSGVLELGYKPKQFSLKKIK